MGAHHGTSPRAIQRRTLRSIRAIWRFAQTSSRVASIATPNCPAGRDRARRFRHHSRSSLGIACTAEQSVQVLRGASAGRASFSHVVSLVHAATVARLVGGHNEPVPTRRARV